ncbi:response regulator [Streptacidiphilus neutrinimicus]|uniref:response regulator n=1 Tax=Streptacidiphilus neutrinimicus TaxID=105420 RepID=UPI0005A85AAF|nr:response regulator transcription factor [Streptacidiphilus neutrinimicus]
MRIVVADDQAGIREALAVMLDLVEGIEVVATAANGSQALDQVAAHLPDAILLDLHMPVLDGTEATRRLTERFPQVAVVVLTTYADDDLVLETLRAGARAYLTKDADKAHIVRTLHSAVTGLTVLDPRVQATLLAAAQRPVVVTGDGQQPSPEPPQERPDALTPREAEILTLLARGLSNQEIAAALFLSHNTVKTHVNRIFTKTGSRDRVAAAHYARRHHLD